jgi:hypothetical protein
MRLPPSARTRVLGERGAISWVTAVLLLALATAGYLAWTFVPVFLDHYEVKQIVREFSNRAVRNPDDLALKREMCLKFEAIREIEEAGEDGRARRVPAVRIGPDEVVWERNASSSPPTLHVAFTYVRRVRLPFLDRAVEQAFAIDSTREIDVPNW